MFWDINSWLDIQIDFEKKMFQEVKCPTLLLQKNSEETPKATYVYI